MADNKRLAVILAIKDKLEEISEIVTVKIGTFEPTHETRPCIGIIWSRDRESRASKQHSVNDMDVTLRLSVDDGAENAGIELLEIVHLIEEKMREDKRLGDLLTDDLQKEESGSLYLDERWPQAGADIDFKFHYQV
jgi:hypothetical protein